jgi:hypothetical protein
MNNILVHTDSQTSWNVVSVPLNSIINKYRHELCASLCSTDSAVRLMSGVVLTVPVGGWCCETHIGSGTDSASRRVVLRLMSVVVLTVPVGGWCCETHIVNGTDSARRVVLWNSYRKWYWQCQEGGAVRLIPEMVLTVPGGWCCETHIGSGTDSASRRVVLWDLFQRWYWQCQSEGGVVRLISEVVLTVPVGRWCCETYVWDGIGFFSRGVRRSPFGTVATFGLLYQPQITDDDACGAIGGMRIGRGNRSIQRKSAPVPLCPPEILHGQIRVRTRAAAVRSRRLTAWTMARPGGTHGASTDGGAVRLKSGTLLTSCWSKMVYIFEMVVNRTRLESPVNINLVRWFRMCKFAVIYGMPPWRVESQGCYC